MSEEQVNEAQHTLDDVIIALQKTFSRVSEQSADISTDRARALVTGEVNFELKTVVNPTTDRLLVNKSGEIELTIKGTLETDIREDVDYE